MGMYCRIFIWAIPLTMPPFAFMKKTKATMVLNKDHTLLNKHIHCIQVIHGNLFEAVKQV